MTFDKNRYPSDTPILFIKLSCNAFKFKSLQLSFSSCFVGIILERSAVKTMSELQFNSCSRVTV
jgi:hypothetical protein